MTAFDQELSSRLLALREKGLHRVLRPVDSPQGTRIRIGDQSLLSFSSNDYLGLANHPQLKESAARAVGQFGAGSGASRLICGSLTPHQQLEEALAAFKATPAAISFSTGYATAIGTICALLGKEDVIVLDKLVHACIVDAARLSGAKLRVFAHNDLDDLEDILKWASVRRQNPKLKSRTLIVTETVFSMDGDQAPLREIVALKEEYGAWLMLDEAHATGLYGTNRRGLAEELGVAEQIEVQMGTLGKAIGASGGYVCGSRELIEYLVNRARSFIFSTAPVPAAAAAATTGIRLVQSAEGKTLRQALWKRVEEFRAGIGSVLARSTPQRGQQSRIESGAIIPIILGEETKATETADELRTQGFFVPAIRYPTVARGSARLRVTLTASHTSEEVWALNSVLTRIINRQS